MAEKSRIVLYIKGNAKALTNPNIAVVGTRHPSEWSQKVEERLVKKILEPKKLLPAKSIMVTCIGTGGVVSINAVPAHINQQINSIILNDEKCLEWLYLTCKRLKSTILLHQMLLC